MQTENAYYERMNQYLREEVAEGDKIEVECSDRRERSMELTGREELRGGGIVLKADGHGTTYQINIPPEEDEGAAMSIRWPSCKSLVMIRGLDAVEKEADLWTDTTAEDLGIPGR
jgi:hypothetical protein